MAEQEEESRRVQYPLDSKSYEIRDEIGRGASANVHKALCIPLDYSVVAIKSIDLDQSKADFDNVGREAKTGSLLSHPNILKAHCSFTVGRELWVVMPFMAAGSLQSIITSHPDGLTEPCIAIILKDTLSALSYLHDQGHLHGDVKAGNILMDSNGAVKLADFGVSASVYESGSSSASSTGSCSSSLTHTDVAGPPSYWMAPEVTDSNTGYSFKADIWSVGITALELAHRRSPLSHLPPSKSLFMKIAKRFQVSGYEETNIDSKKKEFSKSFREMVGLCLEQDPSKRPSAEELLKHSFFRNCEGADFLVKNVLQGLPSVEERFRSSKARGVKSLSEEEEEDEEDSSGENIKQRRISGWNFNVEDFVLNPVFATEKEDKDDDDEDTVRKVRFGGVSIIPDKEGDSNTSSASSSDDQSSNQVCEGSGDIIGQQNVRPSSLGSLGQERFLNSMSRLKNLYDNQRNNVVNVIIDVILGEGSAERMSREEGLAQAIEKLKNELEAEKKKNSALESEIQSMKSKGSEEEQS